MIRHKSSGSTVIMDGAVVIGDVTLGENCSVWFNAVLRGDISAITVGEGTNIQDCTVVHGNPHSAVSIGSGCTVGHNCIIHGCTVGDNTLIGMGSIIMNDAVIGSNCIIGAGTLVTQGKVIPDNSMAFGNPCRIVRQVTQDEIARNRQSARVYMEYKDKYSQ